MMPVPCVTPTVMGTHEARIRRYSSAHSRSYIGSLTPTAIARPAPPYVLSHCLRMGMMTRVQRLHYSRIAWAKQGEQRSLERDKDTGQFTIPAKLAGMGEPEPTFLIQPGAGPNHHRCQLGTYGD